MSPSSSKNELPRISIRVFITLNGHINKVDLLPRNKSRHPAMTSSILLFFALPRSLGSQSAKEGRPLDLWDSHVANIVMYAPTSNVYLVSYCGGYLSANGDGSVSHIELRNNEQYRKMITETRLQWEMKDHANAFYSFKSVLTCKYLCAEKGNGRMVANRTNCKTWEKFRVEQCPSSLEKDAGFNFPTSISRLTKVNFMIILTKLTLLKYPLYICRFAYDRTTTSTYAPSIMVLYWPTRVYRTISFPSGR